MLCWFAVFLASNNVLFKFYIDYISKFRNHDIFKWPHWFAHATAPNLNDLTRESNLPWSKNSIKLESPMNTQTSIKWAILLRLQHQIKPMPKWKVTEEEMQNHCSLFFLKRRRFVSFKIVQFVAALLLLVLLVCLVNAKYSCLKRVLLAHKLFVHFSFHYLPSCHIDCNAIELNRLVDFCILFKFCCVIAIHIMNLRFEER